jgi:hypothetical protein
MQYLCTGNYADGEYPVTGPDEVVELSLQEVAVLLSKAEELDLQEAWAINPKKPYKESESPFGDEDEDEESDGDYVDDDEDQEGDDDDDDDDDDGDDNDGEENEEDENNEDIWAAGGTHAQRVAAGESKLKSDYPHSMFVSLGVYALADRFGIPHLKLLARRRFYNSAVRHVSHSNFAEVVDAVFSAPPSSSPNAPRQGAKAALAQLRDMVCMIVAWRYAVDVDFREKMKEVLGRHSDLAVGVLETTVREGGLVGKSNTAAMIGIWAE